VVERNADALETLISVAAEASPRRPALAWDATGMAATVAHQTGLPEACAKARAALDALDALGGPVPSAEDWPASRADEHRIWITACTDPFGGRTETVPYLHRIAGGSLCDRGKVGGAAWILDETELAVRVLREALSQLRAPGVRGASGAVLSVLEWACIDSGRWDDALAAAREANDIAAAYKMETVAGSADLATATILAMRGDHDRVAPLLARVLTAVDVAEYRGFAARTRDTGLQPRGHRRQSSFGARRASRPYLSDHRRSPRADLAGSAQAANPAAGGAPPSCARDPRDSA
jgi:hypothetical protein